MNNQILLGLVTIGLVASVVGVGTYAYFSDTETSMGNTMTAGTLDLSVSGENPLEGPIVTLSDMKPGKVMPVTEVALWISNNSGKVWKMLTAVDCVTNGQPEPELEGAGDTTNYLPEVTTFAMDVNDLGWSTPVIMSTILGQWMYLGEFAALTPIKVEQSFQMVSTAGNVYQSDQCTFTEKFLVQQTNDPSVPTV